MQCWINGHASGGIDDKIKMVDILLKTNIPSFHHSIIPDPNALIDQHRQILLNTENTYLV